MKTAVGFITLVMVVAAAEARARGAKLGDHRKSKQINMWGRQDPPPPAYPGSAYPTPGGSSPATPQTSPIQPQPISSQPSQPQPISSQPSQPQPISSYPLQPQTGSSYPSQPQTMPSMQQQGGGGGYQQPMAMTPGIVLDPSICKYPGFFATPGSCVNFYRCVDFYSNGGFTIFQFNCGAGTIFDEDIETCNHIAHTVGRRPECTDMLQPSDALMGSGPSLGGAGGGTGVSPSYPQPPQQPGGQGDGTVIGGGDSYPKPGNESSKLFQFDCAGDGKYDRHPLYCNRYYICIEENLNWEFKTLSCPKDLVFDEAYQQCTEPANTLPCTGELAPYPTSEGGSPDAPNTETPAEFPLDPSSQYPCTAEGYFPFEHDCVRFYKCSVTTEDTLIGYRYKCPEGYGYSDEKQRCAAESELEPCDKQIAPASLRGSFPAIQLTVSQLKWFFDL